MLSVGRYRRSDDHVSPRNRGGTDSEAQDIIHAATFLPHSQRCPTTRIYLASMTLCVSHPPTSLRDVLQLSSQQSRRTHAHTHARRGLLCLRLLLVGCGNRGGWLLVWRCFFPHLEVQFATWRHFPVLPVVTRCVCRAIKTGLHVTHRVTLQAVSRRGGMDHWLAACNHHMVITSVSSQTDSDNRPKILLCGSLCLCDHSRIEQQRHHQSWTARCS